MKFAEAPKLTKPLSKFEIHLPHDQIEIVRKEVAGFLEKKALGLFLWWRLIKPLDSTLNCSAFLNLVLISGE